MRREHWSSNLGFVLAIAASAVGLGNVWKFPYILGKNGGGAFMLVYLISILLIGVPLLLCEIAIGRATGKNPFGAFMKIGRYKKSIAFLCGILLVGVGAYFIFSGSPGGGIFTVLFGLGVMRYGWGMTGFAGILTAMLILPYYSVVGGWIFAAFGKSLANAPASSMRFDAIAVDAVISVAMHLLFIFLCMAVLYFGVNKGIELTSKILMPLLGVFLAILIVRGLLLPQSWVGVKFLFAPDFSLIDGKAILEAIGHAFYTLSLGMGITITYGSYAKKSENIYITSLAVVFCDTLVAVMAGLAIFPALFAMGKEPAMGAGLVFNLMPEVFSTMGEGYLPLWCGLFFGLLAIAALTSGVSLLEVGVSFVMDQFGVRRRLAVLWCGLYAMAMGVIVAIASVSWESLPGLGRIIKWLFGANWGSLFDFLDGITSIYMLPLSGLLIVVFAGWVWNIKKGQKELFSGAYKFSVKKYFFGCFTVPEIWGFLVRYVTPVLLVVAFLNGIKLINWC